MNHCKRPRTREFAPTNSGSLKRKERFNCRCTTEELGRLFSSIDVGREILKIRTPDSATDNATVMHRVIVPVFEKIIRAYRYGSAAEKASASVYLEEFIRKDDYIKNRHLKYQGEFKFSV